MRDEEREVHVLAAPVDVVDGEVVDDGEGERERAAASSTPLPWDIDERLREVAAAVDAIDAGARAARVALGPEYVARWSRFTDHWRRFERAHRSMLLYGWQGFDRWEDIHRRVLEYEQRVIDWRRAAEARGVRFPTPEGSARRPPRDLDPDRPMGTTEALGLGALAVIAVVNKLS